MVNTPKFPFEVPIGYRWLASQELIGFEPHTRLQPWYYLSREEIFSVTERWPEGPFSGQLVAFARRQDDDVIACFHHSGEFFKEVVIINGWTDTGYDVLQTYSLFWDWLKSVVDDIAEWVSLAE